MFGFCPDMQCDLWDILYIRVPFETMLDSICHRCSQVLDTSQEKVKLTECPWPQFEVLHKRLWRITFLMNLQKCHFVTRECKLMNTTDRFINLKIILQHKKTLNSSTVCIFMYVNPQITVSYTSLLDSCSFKVIPWLREGYICIFVYICVSPAKCWEINSFRSGKYLSVIFWAGEIWVLNVLFLASQKLSSLTVSCKELWYCKTNVV